MPARQLKQLVEDADDAYVPAAQLEQTLDEATEYCPAAHIPEIAPKPVVAQYDPAVHAAQLEDPVEAI